MRLIAGAILLLAAEQAYAHAQLVPFTNRDMALRVFIPAALGLSIFGGLLILWGLFTDGRTSASGARNSLPRE